MADRTQMSIVIQAPSDKVMDVIADLGEYPSWVSAAKSVEVLESGPDGRARKARFVLDAGMVKDTYVLRYDWAADGKSVSWSLLSGDLQKAQDGSYRLTRCAGRRDNGRLRTDRRPEHPDDRDVQTQSGEGHHGHSIEGTQEAGRRLTARSASDETSVQAPPVGDGRTRVQLFVGKGGVGKTTLACATALAHAAAGQRVLLASIDQAHSLADALGVAIAHDPGTVAGIESVSEHVDAIEIDSLALLEDRFRTLTADWGGSGPRTRVCVGRAGSSRADRLTWCAGVVGAQRNRRVRQ